VAGADVERTDLEAVIADLMSGQYNNPVTVVAFNLAERWANNPLLTHVPMVVVTRSALVPTPERCDHRTQAGFTADFRLSDGGNPFGGTSPSSHASVSISASQEACIR
jgi:hypothetical protein